MRGFVYILGNEYLQMLLDYIHNPINVSICLLFKAREKKKESIKMRINARKSDVSFRKID